MLVRYKIKYYDSFEDEDRCESGIVDGETLGKAVDELSDFYGAEYISELTVYECEKVLTDSEIQDMMTSAS